MKIKQIADIETAIRIYYQYPEIDNNQMRELFGKISSSTAARYKKAAKDEQINRNVKTMCDVYIAVKKGDMSRAEAIEKQRELLRSG